MRSGVIYLYTFPNGKVYVGQTRRDPKVRHREHLQGSRGRLRTTPYLQQHSRHRQARSAYQGACAVLTSSNKYTT